VRKHRKIYTEPTAKIAVSIEQTSTNKNATVNTNTRIDNLKLNRRNEPKWMTDNQPERTTRQQSKSVTKAKTIYTTKTDDKHSNQ